MLPIIAIRNLSDSNNIIASAVYQIYINFSGSGMKNDNGVLLVNRIKNISTKKYFYIVCVVLRFFFTFVGSTQHTEKNLPWAARDNFASMIKLRCMF